MSALPEFDFPEGDERFVTGRFGLANNHTEESKDIIRYMYSQFESGCGSALEGQMGIGICIVAHMYHCNPHEIRKFVFPNHPVGWCKLDFLIRPFSNYPSCCLGIECDGEKWHMNKEKDGVRDKWILGQGIRKIYRYTGAEIKADASNCVLSALTDFCVYNIHHEQLFI